MTLIIYDIMIQHIGDKITTTWPLDKGNSIQLRRLGEESSQRISDKKKPHTHSGKNINDAEPRPT